MSYRMGNCMGDCMMARPANVHRASARVARMRVLALVGWDVTRVEADDVSKQPANLHVAGRRYWIFEDWPVDELSVDIIDYRPMPVLGAIEKRLLRFHVVAPLKAFLTRKPYDLILCFHTQMALPVAIARWLAGGRAPPLVLFDIEGVGRKTRRFYRWLLTRALSSVSMLIAFSRVQLEDYRANYPAVAERAHFLPLGIDLDRYDPDETRRSEDYMLAIGYQDARFRDWDTLIRAYEMVAAGEKVELVIAGKDGFSEADTRLAAPAGVRFAGFSDLAKLNELTRRARFVVLPLAERRHSHGQTTLLGCMALRKAVIASGVGGIVDYVTDGRDAILVRPGCAGDMAEKMLYLLRNPDVARQIALRARESVVEHYSRQALSLGTFRLVQQHALSPNGGRACRDRELAH